MYELIAMHEEFDNDEHHIGWYLSMEDALKKYFLSNASTWKGEVARRVKKELNQMLKEARRV